jgi:hypothetical protein
VCFKRQHNAKHIKDKRRQSQIKWLKTYEKPAALGKAGGGGAGGMTVSGIGLYQKVNQQKKLWTTEDD